MGFEHQQVRLDRQHHLTHLRDQRLLVTLTARDNVVEPRRAAAPRREISRAAAFADRPQLVIRDDADDLEGCAGERPLEDALPDGVAGGPVTPRHRLIDDHDARRFGRVGGREDTALEERNP